MRPISLALGCLLLVASATPLCSETTYGDTYAVPKSDSPPKEDGKSSGGSSRHEDDGGGGFHFPNITFTSGDDEPGPGEQAFPDAPRTGLAGVCFYPYRVHDISGALFLPLWMGLCSAGYSVVISHAHLAFGDDEWENPRPERDRWRTAAGFGLAAAWMARTASGAGTGFHIERVGPLVTGSASALDLRLRAEGSVTAQGMEVDYARPVFQDGRPLGIEHDAMQGYTQWALPLTAELLWHPGTAGFYLGAGAGVVRLHENIDLARSSPVAGRGGQREEIRDSWLPAGTLALGRDGMEWNGSPRWYFEIRYQYLLQSPAHRSSFPSDNIAATHSLGWVWGWYW